MAPCRRRWFVGCQGAEVERDSERGGGCCGEDGSDGAEVDGQGVLVMSRVEERARG